MLAAAREIVEIGGPTGDLYRESRLEALPIERLFEIIGEVLGGYVSKSLRS
ncbi:MAG: hypothetical protein HYR64_00940 [Fimbriimonas ginsengisoli]|uniref:Uncharacterized protein n=1 Tax=Fimbriimonas ginsengisoli TaxID=1005039 RepID=A0A931LQS6_FIMGI|nr:hypothetical protein [Fimbriimonas ginsengisoli]